MSNKNYTYNKAKELSIIGIEYCQWLRKNKREFNKSDQLERAMTSIAANLAEASQAQSDKDLQSKIKIALKEARESMYWIELLEESDLVPEKYKSMKSKLSSIIYLLIKSNKTIKDKLMKDGKLKK